MGNKVFVGGISWNTDEDLLRETFGRYGEVTEARVITDRETGRSRGFGFVSFSDNDAVTKAISELDGSELDGRSIKVNEAQDKPRGDSGGHGGGGGNRW
jgi:cold-inducible RNA-binding protein